MTSWPWCSPGDTDPTGAKRELGKPWRGRNLGQARLQAHLNLLPSFLQRRLKRSFSLCEKTMAGWREWNWWMSRRTVPVQLLVWNRNPREVKHDCNTVCQGLNIHSFVHTPQLCMCSAAPLWADTCLWFIPNIWNISMDNRKKKSLFVWDSGFALVSTCVRPSEV